MKRSEAPKQYEVAMKAVIASVPPMAEIVEHTTAILRVVEAAQNKPEYGGRSDGSINEKMWTDLRDMADHLFQASRLLTKLAEFEVKRLKQVNRG